MARIFLIALILLAGPVLAAEPEVEVDAGPGRVMAAEMRPGPPSAKNAKVAMAATTMFPGLGQLYNEQGLKTLVVFAWESYYLSVILREGQRADLYKRRAGALGEGETWNGLDHGELRARFAAHEERQTDYVWYTGALFVASLLDAYVFAHLHGFETDDIRGRRAAVLPLINPAERSVGLQFRLRY